MTPQQDVAGMLLWLLAAATLLFWAAVLATKWVRVGRRMDRDLPRLLDEKRCQIGKCGQPATNLFTSHPSGALWVCEMHGARIQRPRFDRAPYNQASDISEFERRWDR